MDSVFAESASFFRRPVSQKAQLAWTSAAANRGYVQQGREKVSEGMTAEQVAREREAAGEDLKESMEIGRDDEPAHPNHWPDCFDAAGAGFRTTMADFFDECKALHAVVMRAIALGLGLAEDFFDAFVQRGDNTLRLLHYPAVAPDVFRRNPHQVRAGAHTDYGSITLLFQDDRGGLEVLVDRRGEGVPDGAGAQQEGAQWRPVRPVPGTVVVNAGDLLALWSGGTIRSTKHRVVEPPPVPGATANGAAEHPARYSVAYFCNPDFDKWIEAIPGTFSEGGAKFQGCYSGEYLEQRLAATYS